MASVYGEMYGSYTTGLVSYKSPNRFEWIVSNYFCMPRDEQSVIQSPFFPFEDDAWSIELRLTRNYAQNMMGGMRPYPNFLTGYNVKICVANKNGSRPSRLHVKLGILGRNQKERAIVKGKTNDIGIFKPREWVRSEDILRIVAECSGRLVIFCELHS